MPKTEDPEEPFANQLEWQRHRYDPGHFLGGTLRPEYRLSLGARAKRVAAILSLARGIGLLGRLTVMSIGYGMFLPDPFSLFLGGLTLLVGIKMWTSARAEPAGEDLDVAETRQNIGRVAGIVLVGTAIAVLAALILLAFAATVSAI